MYKNDEKTHAAINKKTFKRLGHFEYQLYEVDVAKPGIDQKEPIFVSFFIPQYAEMRLLELSYIFFTKLCDTDKFEEIEMQTDSSYLA